MKKILSLILVLFVAIMLTACEDKEVEEVEKTDQDIKIIDQTDDGEIVKGVLEGYTFTETEEVTDRVKIQMENGDVILIVLSNTQTPITIENFKKLVGEKFYDGLIFHRVIIDFMIQTGDPTGTGYHGSDETIKGEFNMNGVMNTMSHTRGVISMARSNDPNSASSQFFIVQKDYTSLDGSYAAFGKVFAGMDAVDFIANTETDPNDKPVTEQKIKSIRFIEVEKA